MGKANRSSYNQHLHHHHHHPNNGRPTTIKSKTFFLPLFCRLSLNDVVGKPTKFSSSTSSSSSPDPSSPKISCIGQIKKRSTTTTTTNYHLTATTISIGKSSTNLNYTKLRKLFSGKNLISPPIDSSTISVKCISNRNRSCNGYGGGVTRPVIKEKHHVISIEDLDPPLPVVKFELRDQELKVNLGKRRGIELKTIQIQPFQLSSSTIHHSSNKVMDNGDFTLEPPPPPRSVADPEFLSTGIPLR